MLHCLNELADSLQRAWGKCVTEIRDPETHNCVRLGSFSTLDLAARAYEVAIECLKGESAITSLNVPDSPPQIPRQSSNSLKDIYSSCRCSNGHIISSCSRTPLNPSNHTTFARGLCRFSVSFCFLRSLCFFESLCLDFQ